MGLLLPESGLLFWMLLSFGVVFAVLAKYGFPVITRMVEERRAYVEQSLQAAQEANDQLAQVKAQSEALLQSAREQQMKILNEASATRDQIVAEAKAKAQAETQRRSTMRSGRSASNRRPPSAQPAARSHCWPWTSPGRSSARNSTRRRRR